MTAGTRLSALDTAMLRLERHGHPLHLGALAFFEGAPLLDEAGHLRLAELRRRVIGRLPILPRLRQVPREVPFGRPVWVDDTRFDIEYHVRARRVPPPGDLAATLAVFEEIDAVLLRRDRPLWEFWFLDGLADGRVGLIQKVHHSMVDGVSGVDLAMVLLDVTPDVPEIAVEPWTPAPAPPMPSLIVRDVASRITPVVDAVVRSGTALLRPLTALHHARDTTAPLASLPSPVPGEHGFVAPHTSINRRIGPRRALAVVHRPLDELKQVARANDAKVNDVVLAAVTSGLREVLRARDEPVDDLVLRVLVPVSLRGGSEHLDLGNRVSGFLAPLPLDETDPRRCLRRISSATAAAKERREPAATDMLLRGADLLAPVLIGPILEIVPHQPIVNLVVTNIPGPPFPLYAMGAQMLEAVPLVPLAGNLSLGIAVLSYDGDVTLGFRVDPDQWPDLDDLTAATEAGFDDLASIGPRRSSVPA